MKWTILEETADWLAVDKPSGLLSIPDRQGKEPSLKEALRNRYQHIYTVHRIDRETSGIILFAKTEEAHTLLSQMFEERAVEKWYVGLVLGNPQPASGSIHLPIMEYPGKPGKMIAHAKGKSAHTDYAVMESFRGYSWMRWQIHTGRTHQIRVHMQQTGNALVCDEWYGDGKPLLLSSLKKKFKLSQSEETERPLLARLALHASELHFNWKGTQHSITAPLPKDLSASLQQLRKWSFA